MAILQTRELKKYYGAGDTLVKALDGVELSVENGEFVAIIGTSGSGKSTMLHMLGGLDRPTSGTVTVDGRELSTLKDEELTIFRRRKIGFVFQSFNLISRTSALKNVELPMTYARIPRAARIRRARELLVRVGLEGRMDHFPNELSGGQRQAMALLMSTMTPIEFLILDEHTAARDPKTAELIMELTDKIVKEKNLRTIMVTHNLRFAIEYGNRLVMMHQGNAILDKKGEEKAKMSVDDILALFNEISIECGN